MLPGHDENVAGTNIDSSSVDAFKIINKNFQSDLWRGTKMIKQNYELNRVCVSAYRSFN